MSSEPRGICDALYSKAQGGEGRMMPRKTLPSRALSVASSIEVYAALRTCNFVKDYDILDFVNKGM